MFHRGRLHKKKKLDLLKLTINIFIFIICHIISDAPILNFNINYQYYNTIVFIIWLINGQGYFMIVYYYNTVFMNILNLLLFLYFPLSFKF